MVVLKAGGGATVDHTADVLFEFLRDVFYDAAKAQLGIESLPHEWQQLGRGLVFLAESLAEARHFSVALAKGDLDSPIPPRRNELAAPLKALHAALKHMTWQSQQVAKGDYQQRLEFLGDFALAFNEMTQQLDQRQKALLAEIDRSQQKTKALENSSRLFEAITDFTPQWILVADLENRQLLYKNRALKKAISSNETLRETLDNWLFAPSRMVSSLDGVRSDELEVSLSGQPHFFQVTSYPVEWRGSSALAFLLNDVSEQIEQLNQLKLHAYHDTLTGLYNRFFSLQQLREWMDARKHFCICFVDLDNLKYVNDNLGHSEGDKYIIATATLLEKAFEHAIVGRLGGDEFILLVADMGEAPVLARLEELRQRMMAKCESGKGYISSFSYGVVEHMPDSSISSSDILSLADERMYIFKRANKPQRQIRMDS